MPSLKLQYIANNALLPGVPAGIFYEQFLIDGLNCVI
jgi:hypothetical protein